MIQTRYSIAAVEITCENAAGHGLVLVLELATLGVHVLHHACADHHLHIRVRISAHNFDAEVGGESADVSLLGHHALLCEAGHGGVEGVLAVDIGAIGGGAGVTIYAHTSW